MAETKLKQLKDQYESISTEDLTAIAFNKCQDSLLSLYKANIKAMKDLETKSKEVKALKKKIDDLESTKDVNKGQKDISKEVLKWVVGILGAILVYKITRG